MRQGLLMWQYHNYLVFPTGKLCCLAIFVNVSFVTNKKLSNKFGNFFMGCALATTSLCVK